MDADRVRRLSCLDWKILPDTGFSDSGSLSKLALDEFGQTGSGRTKEIIEKFVTYAVCNQARGLKLVFDTFIFNFQLDQVLKSTTFVLHSIN